MQVCAIMAEISLNRFLQDARLLLQKSKNVLLTVLLEYMTILSEYNNIIIASLNIQMPE